MEPCGEISINFLSQAGKAPPLRLVAITVGLEEGRGKPENVEEPGVLI